MCKNSTILTTDSLLCYCPLEAHQLQIKFHLDLKITTTTDVYCLMFLHFHTPVADVYIHVCPDPINICRDKYWHRINSDIAFTTRKHVSDQLSPNWGIIGHFGQKGTNEQETLTLQEDKGVILNVEHDVWGSMGRVSFINPPFIIWMNMEITFKKGTD